MHDEVRAMDAVVPDERQRVEADREAEGDDVVASPAVELRAIRLDGDAEGIRGGDVGGEESRGAGCSIFVATRGCAHEARRRTPVASPPGPLAHVLAMAHAKRRASHLHPDSCARRTDAGGFVADE